MSWNNNSGGPWGGGPGKGDPNKGESDKGRKGEPNSGGDDNEPINPWGANNGGNNPGRGPGSRGPTPPWGNNGPDFEQLLRKGRQMGSMLPGGFGSARGIGLAVLAGLAVWLASGFYRVEPDQRGVVLTFGRWTDTTSPGLNWHWPNPIQTVERPSVTRDNLLSVGKRAALDPRTGRALSESGETLMLTGDENIVDIEFNVLWRIKDAGAYLFTAREPEKLIRVASESVMRQIIAQTPIQQALTEGRGKVEADTQVLLQQLVDSYGIGVEIRQLQLALVDPPQPVVDAFNEVQRARSDRERLRNEAEAYRNDMIPRARGDAERLIQEAQAFREEVVKRAEGDAKRFLSVYESYKVSKDVTTQRLYLETMEEVLKNNQKIIIDSKSGGQGVLPYLPLPEVKRLTPPVVDTTGVKP